MDACPAAAKVHGPRQVVVAGRVPVRRVWIAGGLVCFALSLLVVAWSFDGHTLRCLPNAHGPAASDEAAGDFSCISSTTRPLFPFTLERDKVVFSLASLADVDVVAKRARHGTLIGFDVRVRFVSGADHHVLSYVDEHDARSAKEEIVSFLLHLNTKPALEISDRPPRISTLGAVYFFIACLALFWHLLRDAGRLAFHIDRREGALVFTRHLLGVPVTRRTFRIDEIEKIDVESGVIWDWPHIGKRKDYVGERFSVLLRNGTRVPLSKRYQRGGFHQAAAEAVGAALRRAG